MKKDIRAVLEFIRPHKNVIDYRVAALSCASALGKYDIPRHGIYDLA